MSSSNLSLSMSLPVGMRLAAMASSDASQLLDVPERRLANDGRPYTRRDFLEFYGVWGEHQWANAEPFIAIQEEEEATTGPPTDRDVAQLPAEDVIANQQNRAASQVPIAPTHTVLGMARMGAFDAQAQILAQSQQKCEGCRK